ncbi:PP2C family serine/threonine-protein phosphatase [Deinococcus apachensis]|uniref:PP2C family serine/threonine-protein phosphatase n=1 Tax=Deinococcus apachensis TaxID=309886 RepID=UPI0012F91B17|nr:PP2C family serine/threonine-protein phosphatase [Deinococcus apachensis]
MSPWRSVHASVMGTAHVTTGQPCQDHHAVKSILNGQDEPLLLLVTSDGAGSAAHSEEGSREVCAETLRWLEICLSDGGDFLDKDAGVRLVHNLRHHLLNYAEEAERNYGLRDLACTLNVAALLPGRGWFVQVGDGATVIERDGGPLEIVFWPDNGEYANQTYFVSDVPDGHIHTRVIAGCIDRVALMTDGLQAIALSLQQRAPHAPFFTPMFRALEALDAPDTEQHGQLQAGLIRFLDSPAVNARTSDDKTLVLSSRRPAPEATPVEPAEEVEAV